MTQPSTFAELIDITIQLRHQIDALVEERNEWRKLAEDLLVGETE